MADQPVLGDAGSGEDALSVHRDAPRSKSEQAFAELAELRRRADGLGVDWRGVPLGELRAAVEQAEGNGG